jgi:threonine dehydrogenase-like Zn-dependent dehydrogenase
VRRAKAAVSASTASRERNSLLHRFVSGRIGFERDGAMAEYVVVSEECLHRIPAGVTMEEAAMTEPAAVAPGTVERGF